MQNLLEVRSKYSEHITPKFSTIKKGTRLYGPRLQGVLDQVSESLSDAERDILIQILYNREAALTWDFDECGSLDPIVAPPQILKVVEHSAWQAGSIPIPKGLKKKVVELLKTRIKRKILEESHAVTVGSNLRV